MARCCPRVGYSVAIRRYRISPNKMFTIEVGVDYPKFMQSLHKITDGLNVEKKSQKARLGDSKHLIVYSGILGPAYDFEMLLKATKRLEEELDSFNLIIHGKGPSESYIKSQISKLGLKQTLLLSETLSFNDYLKFLLSGSLFLLPMKKGIFSETAFPSKLFTYLMLDKPIISTKGGDVEIILKESKAGVVVSHDYKELARMVKLLIENKEIYNQYCGKGSIYAKNHFNLRIIKKKLDKLLEEIIAE